MKNQLQRISSEIDSALALGIAATMSVLGLFSVTSTTLTNNAILVTLAVLALSIFRDRWRRDAADDDVSLKLTELLNRSHPVRLLGKQEVIQAFANARQSTHHWIFKGGTGSYVRAVTLPECYRIAHESRHKLSVRLEILDPTDLEICERYANFRRSVMQPTDHSMDEWTMQRVQEELYATILAACWYRQRFVQPDIEVGLTRTMSTFRYDMSETSLIITQDDSVLSQFIPRKSELYRRHEVELFISHNQATPVPLKKASSIPLDIIPTSEGVSQVFQALELPLHSSVDRGHIIQRAFHAKNPYP
jgi:hypothetical protein